jgi:hypothetical protein
MWELSDFEEVRLTQAQFQEWQKIEGAHINALWRIAETLTLLKDRHQKVIETATADVTKWLGIQNTTISAGFASVVEAIAKLQIPLPPPQPKQTEVRFVFKVADDHQSESFSISIGGVTDAEGQTISDPSGLSVKVASSDESILAVSFDEASKSGSVSFGSPGVASLTATVSNAKGDILGSGAADFTVTTGDPAAVSDVKIGFSGLTEEPPV